MSVEKVASSAVNYFKASPVYRTRRAPFDIAGAIVRDVADSNRSVFEKRKGLDTFVVREVNKDGSYVKHIIYERPDGVTEMYSIPMKNPGKWMDKIRSLFRIPGRNK